MALTTDPICAAELLPLAKHWLAERHPDAVIVTELSVADWGGALIDIAAITGTHIVGVEIKGAGDSPARLDRQGLAYGMVAREMWLLPCPTVADKCWAKRPAGWGRLEVWDGAVRPLNTAQKPGGKVKTKYGHRIEYVRDDSAYAPAQATIGGHLCPAAICGTLWRDELAAIAARHRVTGIARGSYIHVIAEALEAHLPAPVLHDEMIYELRRRTWRKPVLDLRDQSRPQPTLPDVVP